MSLRSAPGTLRRAVHRMPLAPRARPARRVLDRCALARYRKSVLHSREAIFSTSMAARRLRGASIFFQGPASWYADCTAWPCALPALPCASVPNTAAARLEAACPGVRRRAMPGADLRDRVCSSRSLSLCLKAAVLFREPRPHRVPHDATGETEQAEGFETELSESWSSCRAARAAEPRAADPCAVASRM